MFRNVCTLHELDEELSKMENVQTFDDLRLGPLQKQLIVYDLFQFPPDRPDIPPITTHDVFRLLWRLFNEKQQHEKKGFRLPDGSTSYKDLQVRIMMPEILEFIRNNYGLKVPEESGVRIANIGTALQV